MDLQEILKTLQHNDGRYPREAISEALLRRDEIIPALLAVLDDVRRDPDPYLRDTDLFIHIYAMFLLAQLRETRAYPLLVDIFSAPGESAFDLVGDLVTEELGRILASVSGGDVRGICTLVEDEEANEYVRSAGFTALLTVCASGALSRDDVIAYFQSLFRKLKRTPDGAWNWLAHACADLCSVEVMHELRQAYDDDLIDPMCISWREVESAMARGKEAAMSRLEKHNRLVTDVHQELSGWCCFNQDRDSDFSGDLDDPRPWPGVVPIYRAEPKIGRNDPCYCGSGKKLKKCCGR